MEQWTGGVTPVKASISDGATLPGAAEGCDAVIHIAGIVAEDPPEITFEKVNVEGTRNLVAEAEQAGVGRFIYISSLGADRGESDYHAPSARQRRSCGAFPATGSSCGRGTSTALATR